MSTNNTIERKHRTFTDAHGRIWFLELTTPALIDACQQCDVRLDELLDMRINASTAIRCVWFAARIQAHIFGVKDENEFFTDVLTPALIPAGFQAFFEALEATFPAAEDMLGEYRNPSVMQMGKKIRDAEKGKKKK